MKSQSFKNFQVGILDDPSIEDEGGFEYASGMDIFSEPGVIKACNALTPVSFGTGATPSDGAPTYMEDIADASNMRLYVAAGSKVLESTDGATFNLFRTNGNGVNLGLAIFNDYVWYASAAKLGRSPVGNSATANDNYSDIPSDTEFHPMVKQAGTLKGGAGRYVFSVDESSVVTQQAMKLVNGYRIKALKEHAGRLFMGTKFGGVGGSDNVADATVFDWRGIVLSSGSALPDNPYPIKLYGLNALLTNGRLLFAFADRIGPFIFDGVGFTQARKLREDLFVGVEPGAVSEYKDTILFGGAYSTSQGVYQMKGQAYCPAFVPSTATPGNTSTKKITLIKATYNTLYVGYLDTQAATYHFEKLSDNKQNGALFRTAWHRMKTDRFKRWYGVKLNLKPLAANTSVAVAYRTDRNASFTDSGFTITSSNQDKPVLLAVRPRSREIQFKFTFTTSTTNTPELLSYDPIYEVLNTVR
jgi:hypothetical protein